MKQNVETQVEQTKRALATVEDVEKVVYGETLAEINEQRLKGAMHSILAALPPVKASVAARVLGLSAKTVRQWTHDGVLTEVKGGGPLAVDAESLYEVLRLVRDLREAGRTRGLLDEVWRRLSDQALLDSPDIQESLAQMRRGEGVVLVERDSA